MKLPKSSYFGHMDVFNPKEEELLTYVERLEMFFVVNNVPEERKAAILLTLMGGKMHTLLKSLTTPLNRPKCHSRILWKSWGDIRHQNRLLSLSGTSSINVFKKKVSGLKNFFQSCKNSLKHANSATTVMRP